MTNKSIDPRGYEGMTRCLFCGDFVGEIWRGLDHGQGAEELTHYYERKTLILERMMEERYRRMWLQIFLLYVVGNTIPREILLNRWAEQWDIWVHYWTGTLFCQSPQPLRRFTIQCNFIRFIFRSDKVFQKVEYSEKREIQPTLRCSWIVQCTSQRTCQHNASKKWE